MYVTVRKKHRDVKRDKDGKLYYIENGERVYTRATVKYGTKPKSVRKSRKCKRGTKKSGGCKKKPGRKSIRKSTRKSRKTQRKSTRKSTRKSRKTQRKSTRKSRKTQRKSTRKSRKTQRKSTRKCKRGTKKSGGCKKKPGRKSIRKSTRKSRKTQRKSTISNSPKKIGFVTIKGKSRVVYSDQKTGKPFYRKDGRKVFTRAKVTQTGKKCISKKRSKGDKALGYTQINGKNHIVYKRKDGTQYVIIDGKRQDFSDSNYSDCINLEYTSVPPVSSRQTINRPRLQKRIKSPTRKTKGRKDLPISVIPQQKEQSSSKLSMQSDSLNKLREKFDDELKKAKKLIQKNQELFEKDDTTVQQETLQQLIDKVKSDKSLSKEEKEKKISNLIDQRSGTIVVQDVPNYNEQLINVYENIKQARKLQNLAINIRMKELKMIKKLTQDQLGSKNDFVTTLTKTLNIAENIIGKEINAQNISAQTFIKLANKYNIDLSPTLEIPKDIQKLITKNKNIQDQIKDETDQTISELSVETGLLFEPDFRVNSDTEKTIGYWNIFKILNIPIIFPLIFTSLTMFSGIALMISKIITPNEANSVNMCMKPKFQDEISQLTSTDTINFAEFTLCGEFNPQKILSQVTGLLPDRPDINIMENLREKAGLSVELAQKSAEILPDFSNFYVNSVDYLINLLNNTAPESNFLSDIDIGPEIIFTPGPTPTPRPSPKPRPSSRTRSSASPTPSLLPSASPTPSLLAPASPTPPTSSSASSSRNKFASPRAYLLANNP